MISETKIDDSFSLGNFLIDGFSEPYRLQGDLLGGGILLHVRKYITSNLPEVETRPIESFYVEINLHNDKWLINCLYNPHKNVTGNHFPCALSEKLSYNNL